MGETAIVIGGTGGIGRHIVNALAERGCHTAIITRGQHVVETQPYNHAMTSSYFADVTREVEFRSVVEKVRSEFGRLNFVVYSTGLPPDVDIPLTGYPLINWDRTFDTYVKGFLISFRTTLPHLAAGGHFLVIGSAITRFSSDSLPPISAGHYAAAKAALTELVKWARREAHEQGAMLSLISPGAKQTN